MATQLRAMSSHQGLPSPLASLEHGGSLIHIVNIAPLSLLLTSMDPEPTADPHAKLVIVSFQECPALQTPAWDWSPTTPPDWVLVKGLGWRGVRGSAADEGEDYSQEGNIVDVWIDEGCEEMEMLPSSQGCSPGLAGHAGDLVAQKQETVVVDDMIKWDLVRGCTLPSLKELGLDIYVEKRY